ncbi:unnamed protein product [Rotaria socialis]|uniref:F-box domain-containing protein n=1 Tax=Rotaria socialis TaxID=392032 RepID=A0A820TRI9_9BILA|nr:unnamed protein product [Rotaria socialis]
MLSRFHNLPDLAFIEILSYLSCADALWSFSKLNIHLTKLLIERGFYHHVNLSSTRYCQFQTFLSLLRLNEIQSLVIDCYGSSLQLKTWPYLPNLRTLKVKGAQDLVDVFKFAQQHANTLTHLTVESSQYFETCGIFQEVCYPAWNLCDFITEVFHHLPALRSLDLGTAESFFLHRWNFKTIQTPLINLTLTLSTTHALLMIMSTEPLAHTLQRLHITLNDHCSDMEYSLCDTNLLPEMKALHIFSFTKSFVWHCIEEWKFIDALTSSRIMPILRRMNFSVVIDVNDLVEMNRSALFTDFRHIDVHYTFIINDDRSHMELREYILHNNKLHSNQIVSATFISESWPGSHPFITPGQNYRTKQTKSRQHLFYTLPWIFKEFFELCVPDRYNLPSSATFFSHLISSNEIFELHLLRCDRQVSMNLPNLRHLILTDSLDSLNSFQLSKNIRSIQITLHHQCTNFATCDWTALRKLSSLPELNSLRVLLYNMHISPDDTSCQIIADVAPMISDFSFCFRRRHYQAVYDLDSAQMKQSSFIEQLKNRILALSLNKQPYIVVEEDERWEKACQEKNTSLHLIKSMELDLDVGKCIYSDDAVLPAWKVAGSLPNVELRLSDKRLCQIINNIQLIPFPESKNPVILGPPIEPESTLIQSLSNNPEQTLEAVEGMIPVKKTKEKVEAEENKKQYLHLINLHIDEGANENNEDKPFFRLTLESIVAKTKIKTFDMEFDASLANSVVYHEQFIGKDNQQLRLLSAQLEQINNDENQKLVSLNFLHTSSENPLFLSPTYNGIENRAHVHFSKLAVTL